MHRCLEIPEILSLICYELSGPSQLTPQSQASLIALARTSQNFKEPALDALWRYQTSLIPLVKCLPEDSWEYGVEGNVKSLRFSRPLDPPDWERVLFYAHRIKILRYVTPQPLPRRTQEYAPLAVWQVLAVCRPPSLVHLVPTLRELLWKESDTCFPYIRLLLAPTLTRLDLILKGSEVLRLSFLSTVNALCPSLTHVNLTYPLGLQMAQAVSRAICQWRSIKSLDASTLTTQAFNHLAQMSSLETLVCSGIPADYIPPNPRTFPALRHVTLCSAELPLLASFLNAIGSEPRLESIDVTISPQPSTASPWKTMFNLLTPFRTTLTTVRLREDSRSENKLDVTDPEVLRLLFTLPNLVHLSIHPQRLSANDQLLQEIAARWPGLCHLDLTSPHTYQPLHITPGGLLPLAIGCPELEYLALPLDTSILESCHGTEVANTSLKTLKLHCLPRGDPAKVVASLIGIFPNLKTFRIDDDRITFRQFECALQALRALRRRAPVSLG